MADGTVFLESLLNMHMSERRVKDENKENKNVEK